MYTAWCDYLVCDKQACPKEAFGSYRAAVRKRRWGSESASLEDARRREILEGYDPESLDMDWTL